MKKLITIFGLIFLMAVNIYSVNPITKGIKSPSNKKMVIVSKTKKKYKPRVKSANQRIKEVKEQIEKERKAK